MFTLYTSLMTILQRYKNLKITYNKHTVQKNEICSCTDSNGQIKDLYDSEISAKEQINQILKEKRVQLSIYICPYGCGWHLTKS